MKRKILILTMFCHMFFFPSASLGEWKYLSTSIANDVFYVDYDRIRFNNGNVYFWVLNDYQKPLSTGHKSSKSYMMGDCKMYRVKGLTSTFYMGQMGKGDFITSNNERNWIYPIPNSIDDAILKFVCEK